MARACARSATQALTARRVVRPALVTAARAACTSARAGVQSQPRAAALVELAAAAAVAAAAVLVPAAPLPPTLLWLPTAGRLQAPAALRSAASGAWATATPSPANAPSGRADEGDLRRRSSVRRRPHPERLGCLRRVRQPSRPSSTTSPTRSLMPWRALHPRGCWESRRSSRPSKRRVELPRGGTGWSRDFLSVCEDEDAASMRRGRCRRDGTTYERARPRTTDSTSTHSRFKQTVRA